MVGSSAIRISWGRSSTASRGPAAIAAAAAALGAPAYPYPSVGVVPAAPAFGAAYPGYDAGAYRFAGAAPPAADPYAVYYAAIATDPAAYQARAPLRARRAPAATRAGSCAVGFCFTTLLAQRALAAAWAEAVLWGFCLTGCPVGSGELWPASQSAVHKPRDGL